MKKENFDFLEDVIDLSYYSFKDLFKKFNEVNYPKYALYYDIQKTKCLFFSYKNKFYGLTEHDIFIMKELSLEVALKQFRSYFLYWENKNAFMLIQAANIWENEK